MTVQSVGYTSPLIAGEVSFTHNLSPDAMMVYLQTRLDGLDKQVNTIFNDQQRQQKAQSILRKIENEYDGLDDKATDSDFNAPANGADGSIDFKARVDAQLKALEDIDPSLASRLRAELNKEGHVLGGKNADGDVDTHYVGREVTASRELLQGVGKDLESAAQMNMIRLQSIMSARQTAVQLATNLVSSLGESTKAIVSNLGR